MDIEMKPLKVARMLTILAIGLAVAYFAVRLVGISFEHTILNFYTAVMLLLCSILLLTIAMAKKQDNPQSFLYWLGLAFLFLFLAIMKDTAIHESLAVPIRSSLNMSKFQFYAWVYGIVVVVFPLFFIKFFLYLPWRTKLFLAVGCFAFILGAFIFDFIVAYLGKSIDHRNLVYIGLDTFEDVLEMSGIIVIVYALMMYMNSEFKWIRVKISG